MTKRISMADMLKHDLKRKNRHLYIPTSSRVCEVEALEWNHAKNRWTRRAESQGTRSHVDYSAPADRLKQLNG